MGLMKKQKEKQKIENHSCPYCFQLYKTGHALNTHIGKKHAEEHAEAVEREKKALENKLSPQEEFFCELWASDREFFGNGTQSYIEAFEVKLVKKPDPDSDDNEMTYDQVRYAAHKLLTDTNILRRINEIFETRGLNDAFVDKQLEVVITQNAEFSPKIKAIAEYNKLKKRTTETVEHVHAFSDIKGMTGEELAREKEKLMAFFQKK